jgi:hypothetical protein
VKACSDVRQIRKKEEKRLEKKTQEKREFKKILAIPSRNLPLSRERKSETSST